MKSIISIIMTMFAMAVLMATSIVPHHHHGDLIYWFPDDCPICSCEGESHLAENDSCAGHGHHDNHDNHDEGRCIGLSPYLAAAHDTRDQSWLIELTALFEFTITTDELLVSLLPERIDDKMEVFDENKDSHVFLVNIGLRSPPNVINLLLTIPSSLV